MKNFLDNFEEEFQPKRKKAGKDLWAKEPRKKPKVKKFKYKDL